MSAVNVVTKFDNGLGIDCDSRITVCPHITDPLRRALTTSPLTPLLNGQTARKARMEPRSPRQRSRNSSRIRDGGLRAGKMSLCRRIWLRERSTKPFIASASHCSRSRLSASWLGWFHCFSTSLSRRCRNLGSSGVDRFSLAAATYLERDLGVYKSTKKFKLNNLAICIYIFNNEII